MENASYVALTRQSGLLSEMRIVANNMANLSTTGFRKEGLLFSEFIRELDGRGPSLSMATGDVRATFLAQGELTSTGSELDLAIEGTGFFLVSTPDGEQLTRAGNFSLSPAGELVTTEGYNLLDAGGAPIFIPPDSQDVSIGSDGTVSADGRSIAQIGLYLPADPASLERRDGVRFLFNGAVLPSENASILQGFLENSNVNPVFEIARMIEVQRSYELGQTFLDREDERIRNVLQTLGK